MRQIDINKHSKLVPVNWNELTKAQLLVFIKSFYLKSDTIYKTMPLKNGQKKHISTNAGNLLRAQILILWSLLGIKWSIFQRISKEQLHELLYIFKLTDFLFFQNNLTRNIFPTMRYRFWKRKLYGPADNFKNIRAREYTFAELAYKKYKQTNDIKHLNMFIAILYRNRRDGEEIEHPDWDGDYRERFNNKNVESRLPHIKKIPLSYKIAVLLWYEGCMNQIKREFRELYSGAGGKGIPAQSFDDIIIEYAGGKFGNYNQTGDTFLRDLLKAVCTEIQKSEKNEGKN